MLEVNHSQTFEFRISILKEVSVFSDTNVEILMEIAKLTTGRIVAKGETIIEKGDQGNAVYIIAKGKVCIHDGDYVFTRQGTGQIFGEYALIDTQPRSATVTAEEETDLLVLESNDFYKIVASHNEVIKGILRVLINRVREMNQLEEQIAKSYNEIKAQKEKIEKQKENIHYKNKELEAKNNELVDLNQEKNHLIGIVAHDLRNPLASNISIAQLLKSESDSLSGDQVEYVDAMLNSLNRMNDMITRILDVKSVESKNVRLELEKMNLAKVINKVIVNFEDMAVKKNLSISFTAEDVYTYLDKNFTTQVFENLISNAIKFSPPGKSIKIIIQDSDEKVNVSIIDEGPGFSKEDLKKLFGKFQRLSARPTAGEDSTGLGLSIVKKYVEAMNGSVWCESEHGAGATFVVQFNNYNAINSSGLKD